MKCEKKIKKQWFGQSFISTELGHPIYAWFMLVSKGRLKKKINVIKSAWTFCYEWDAWNWEAQLVKYTGVWVEKWVWASKDLKKKNTLYVKYVPPQLSLSSFPYEHFNTYQRLVDLKRIVTKHLLFLTSNCNFFISYLTFVFALPCRLWLF